MSLVIIVGADKGGVGKTMVSRCLLDYYASHSILTSAIDTQADVPTGVLKRFWPSAELIDIATVPGQMKTFDAIRPAAATVIDLRAGLLSTVLEALTRTGVMMEVQGGTFRLIALHVIGPTVASISEVASIAARVPAASHIIVKNEAVENAEWPDLGGRAVISIPHLPEPACHAVDQADATFNQFVATDDGSRILRGYVRHWLDAAWKEFTRVGLGRVGAS